MRELMNLIILSGAIVAGSAGTIRSGETPEKLTVVLSGQGDQELAPHGQGNVYAPDVMRDGKLYRMWYGGQGKDGHDRIAYAESRNGKTWTRKGVVIDNGSGNHVNDPSVIKVGKSFYMYFTRTEKDVIDRIDVAVSTNGNAWSPKGIAISPGAAESWDGLSVGRPSVIFDEGIYKLWYDGRKDFPPGAPVHGVPTSNSSSRSVGYATSQDGLTWVKYEKNPVFGHDAGAVDVKRLDDKLIMVYESREGTRFATSKNGIDWKDGGTIIAKSGSPVDKFGHVTPCLFLDPDQKRHQLFVGAASATTWDHNRIASQELSHDDLLERITDIEK